MLKTKEDSMQNSIARPSDRFIPFYIIGFFVFLIVLLSSFVWISVHGYNGEITKDAYKKGLEYNKILATAEEQKQLGWKDNLQITTQNLNAQINFSLSDKLGNPITNAQVKVWFVRPVQSGHDFNLPLIADGKGNYTAKTKLDLTGLWEAHISATYNKQNYQKVAVIQAD